MDNVDAGAQFGRLVCWDLQGYGLVVGVKRGPGYDTTSLSGDYFSRYLVTWGKRGLNLEDSECWRSLWGAACEREEREENESCIKCFDLHLVPFDDVKGHNIAYWS